MDKNHHTLAQQKLTVYKSISLQYIITHWRGYMLMCGTKSRIILNYILESPI